MSTPENDFLPFAAATGANVLSQSAYASSSALSTGFQSGVAQSAALNKVWRQSSIIAAVVAQFIADCTNQDVIDDGTTAIILANLKKAVANQSVDLVGAMRNAKMTVTAASVSATFTADQIIVGSALNGFRYSLASYSETINLATTGAGGMDTGSAPTSGYVALYAIYNPTTSTASILATNATSSVAPTIYGGANMPSGYTASALISVWPTNSSGQFILGNQQDRSFKRVSVNAFSTTSQASTPTSVSISAVVPPNARTCGGSMILANSAGNAGCSCSFFGNANSVSGKTLLTYIATSGGAATTPFEDLQLESPQTVYYTSNTNAGTLTTTMNVNGYTF